MSTNNLINSPLTGTTGSGEFVGSNSPTMVSPTLGAALATSINFGDSSLETYKYAPTFIPTITFDTPGDLIVSYNSQTGYYSQIGSIILVNIGINCSLTFTTASGNVQIGGLPFTNNNLNLLFVGLAQGAITWTGQLSAISPIGNSYFNLVASPTGGYLNTANFTSGLTMQVNIAGTCFA